MAFDAFLKIEGIQGESEDHKHKNEIDVLSFSFGISRRNNRGRSDVTDFSIVKVVDTSSPLLFDASCQGEPIQSAQFVARKAGKEQLEFLKIKFEDVIISSVQHSGAAGTDSVPMESVSLDFRSMEMEVFSQNPDGSIGKSTKTICASKGRA